jgi:hypothetical protein
MLGSVINFIEPRNYSMGVGREYTHRISWCEIRIPMLLKKNNMF